MSSTSDEGDLAAAKEELREEMRSRREALHERERALRSARVMEQVVGAPEWGDADVVGFYVSVGSEVETRRALAAALDDVQVAAPRADPGDGSLAFAPVEDLDDLEEGPLGVPEPAGPALDPADLDLVLVPGLAFGEDGARLGRGGGYYDRFLEDHEGWACGLAYRFQLRETIPAGPGDVPVDAVATEHGVHRPASRED